MSSTDELIKIGKYNTKFNDILEVEFPELEIYVSKGLKAHIEKRKHYKALKYFDKIKEILESPDYIGINPNENVKSFEVIKIYKDNVMIGIKHDEENNYFYISTMIDIQQGKINRRLYSGRLKSFK